MTDPRDAARTLRARWLRVRAGVRALAARLAAADHALQRDARRSGDAEMRVLVEQLARERRAVAALGADLDDRLRAVDVAVRATERDTIDALRASPAADAEAGPC